MGYLVEGLELFIHKVAYTKYDATVLVLWSNYTTNTPLLCMHFWPSLRSSHSNSEVILQKYSKLTTLSPFALCKGPEEFFRTMFKHSRDFIQFILKNHLVFGFYSLYSKTLFIFIYDCTKKFYMSNCNILK
jgi:hypothetical protein